MEWLYGNSVSKSDPNVRKWDLRFLKWINSLDGPRSWSKDPSRQVCAAIVKPNRRLVSIGYNGFASGVGDLEERYLDRDVKLKLVVHAEENALITAERDCSGFHMYVTLLPCSPCAAKIINAGISKVVALGGSVDPTKIGLDQTYGFDLTRIQFQEAGVKLVEYEYYELAEV